MFHSKAGKKWPMRIANMLHSLEELPTAASSFTNDATPTLSSIQEMRHSWAHFFPAEHNYCQCFILLFLPPFFFQRSPKPSWYSDRLIDFKHLQKSLTLRLFSILAWHFVWCGKLQQVMRIQQDGRYKQRLMITLCRSFSHNLTHTHTHSQQSGEAVLQTLKPCYKSRQGRGCM